MNKDFSCPMWRKSCQFKINIENEEIEDFSVTNIRGIKYFNLMKEVECHAEKREYSKNYTEATMCISIEPILVGDGIVEIRNRITNSTIYINVYITKPQNSFSEAAPVIIIIQSLIVASFLDINKFLSSFYSISKCQSKLKRLGYLFVVFTRTISILIVSISFHSKKENFCYSFYIFKFHNTTFFSKNSNLNIVIPFTYFCFGSGLESNLWTLLLDGDINLGFTLTFTSTVVQIATGLSLINIT